MRACFLVLSVVMTVVSMSAVKAQDAVVTDSRIKTLVYNPNDVFSLLMVYGYQSNIEFSSKEDIQTVSVGDRVGWQIVPSGHRLFIRPQEFGAHTNMTVITNKRAYQFDLKSAPDENLPESEELVYVARFFYPEDDKLQGVIGGASQLNKVQPQGVLSDMRNQNVTADTNNVPVKVSSSYVAEPNVVGGAVGTLPSTINSPKVVVDSVPVLPKNYNYTYSGNIDYAPVKVYDDGKITYVALAGKVMDKTGGAEFFKMDNGKKTALVASIQGDATYVVNEVLGDFSIQYKDGTQIQVFNESFKNK